MKNLGNAKEGYINNGMTTYAEETDDNSPETMKPDAQTMKPVIDTSRM